MTTRALQIEMTVDPQWDQPLRQRLADLSLGYGPVFASVGLSGVDLVAALDHLDAMDRDALPVAWTLEPDSAAAAGAAFRDPPGHAGVEPPGSGRVPGLGVRGARVTGLRGAFVFELEGARYGAAVVGAGRVTETILAAPSLDELGALLATLRDAADARDREALRVYGGERYAGPRRLPEIDEDRVVLPPSLKSELLRYVDAFARVAGGDAVADGTSRGVLLLGRPGTGKTLMARHVLRRVADARRFLFVQAMGGASPFDERSFERMVVAIERGPGPAVVLVEDIDRMFDQGATTPQYFLNVLDGALRPSVPVLWVATSNDPGDLAANLLDRPGRFDRVFLFPVPDADARRALFEMYATGPLDPAAFQPLVSGSDGLTGAHIRETCRSAAIRAEADGVEYVDALGIELDRTQRRHRDSRAYARELRGGTAVGFERAS